METAIIIANYSYFMGEIKNPCHGKEKSMESLLFSFHREK